MTVFAQDSVADAVSIFDQQRFHHLPVLDETKQLCGMITDRDVMRFMIIHGRSRLAKTPIQQVMTKKIITAAESTEIRSIANVMCQQGFSAMPITEANHTLMGVVTRSDILRTLVNEAPLELWV